MLLSPGENRVTGTWVRVVPFYIYRHLTPDTIVPEVNSPQSYNRYSYVLNDPLNLVDPSGHCYFDPSSGASNCASSYLVDISAYDAIVLVGLDAIPRPGDDLSRIGVVEVNFQEDFGTLGSADSPANAAIIYSAGAANLSENGWDNVTDDIDLLARIVEQEAAGLIHTYPNAHDVEMVGVAQVATGRVGAYGDTLREVLLAPNQFAFTLLGDQAAAARDAAEAWADPLDRQSQRDAYERALAVSVGVDQGWLCDPRTAGATEFRGTRVAEGYYTRFFVEFPLNPIVVNDYP